MEAIRQALMNSPTKRTITKNRSSPKTQQVKSKTTSTNKTSKIELKSNFTAPGQIHPALKPTMISNTPVISNTSPSSNLVKVSAYNLSSKPTFSRNNKIKLKKASVQVLYSLDELSMKTKKMKEKSKKLQVKNALLLIQTKTTQSLNYEDSDTEISEIKSVKVKPRLESNKPKSEADIPKIESNKQTLKMDQAKFEEDKPKVEDIVDDDDSDIEVEEINIISKPEQVNSTPSESDMGGLQSNFVISGIMKQVEELETTLKMNVAKKESELEAEKQVVEQMKKKITTLELRDKKRKEVMERKESEASKEVEKRNNEIETLKSFTNSMAQKLSQQKEEMQSFSKKQQDLMSQKLAQKQHELTGLNKKFEKVSLDLDSLQKWKSIQDRKSVQDTKEKENFKKLIQGKENIHKQKIDALEKIIKEKDEVIAKHEKSIQSMDVKLGDKDKLAKELKLKVSKLIKEFTKGFKEKDEELDCKNKEIDAKSTEIERLKGKLLDKKRTIAAKNKEVENKEIMNERQVIMINDLSKKLSKAESDANKEKSLHEFKEQNFKMTLQNLKERSSTSEKQLQDKLSKLKTLHSNGFIIKSEDLFEDKLEEFIYENKNQNKNKPLMITYSWPVFRVHVDPCLLEERQEEETKDKPISKIKVQVKPLMLTYLWPVLPFQHQLKTREMTCRGLKRKISITSLGKRVKLSVEHLNISSISINQVSLPKMVEQVIILDDTVELTDRMSLNQCHNWPIIPINQVNSHKRKFQHMIEHQVKMIKLDTELVINVPLKGRIKLDSCKRLGRRNKGVICGKEITKEEILKLNLPFQVKIPLFDPLLKEIKLGDKPQYRKSQEAIDTEKSWPMVLYQENTIVQSMEFTGANILKEEQEGTDSTIELNLQDTLGDFCIKKRKFEEDFEFEKAKRTRFCDNTRDIVEFLDETLDYILSKVN